MAKIKKLLAVLVCMAMALAVMPGMTAWAAKRGVTADGLVYYVYDDHVEITGYNGDAKEIDIPAIIEGLPVTVIGDRAFYWCDRLTSVTIPDGVTSIGERVFDSCASVKSIIIPDGVTSIGDYAFIHCISLTSVKIGDSVTSIGYGAFDYCYDLTSIDVTQANPSYKSCDGVLFNKTMTELIRYPIGNNMTNYSIPYGVNSIGDESFKECGNLTSVTIPDGVTSIGDDAFYDCDSLVSVTMGDSVTTIGECAFLTCNSLTSVTIPDSVKSIGARAFQYCGSLTSLTIPDNVASIGDDAFSGCYDLTSIDVTYANPSYTSHDGVLFDKAMTKLIQYPIGNSRISYEVPNGVTSIGYDAFRECESLTSVTITNSVVAIGDWAFYSCFNLTSVTISNSIVSIGSNAFDRCDSLTDVYYTGSEEEWLNISIGYFNDPLINAHYNSIRPEDVPVGLKYKAYNDHLEITGYTGSATELTIPAEIGGLPVTSIGSNAFSENTSLVNINLPDSVTEIGEHTFQGCVSLEKIHISESVKLIGDFAFGRCNSLQYIEVDQNNASYYSEDGVLFDKNGPTLIRYPSGKKETAYSIPDGVTNIFDWAFEYSNNITELTIPGSVTEFGISAFCGCSNLVSVTIMNGVTSIGQNWFDNCSSLASVIIPDSITSIDNYAFMYCGNLTDVYYAGSEEDWANISIGYSNEPLLNATIHYNSTGPEPPAEPEISEPEITVEGENLVIDTQIDNIEPGETVTLVVIADRDDGCTISWIDGGSGSVTVPAEGVKTVKVFAWESLESMRPLCEAREVAVAR